MRYLKKYKLYESVADIFKKLPIEESEISDILIDLTDDGYNIKYRSFFLSEKGRTYEDSKGIGNYYPVVLISITREKKEDNDVRKWDGSLYFEDSDSVLESIYHSISRLKSTLSDYKLYYNIRNINEIYMRIVFDMEKQDDFNYEFAMNEYRKLVDKYSNIDGVNGRYDADNFTSFYEFEEGVSTKDIISTEVSPIIYRRDVDDIDINNPKNIISDIIKGSVNNLSYNNKYQLFNLYKLFVNEYVKKLNRKYSVRLNYNGSTTYTIVSKVDECLYITFQMDYEAVKTYKVLTKEGGFMRRDKYENVQIYKLDIDVIFRPMPYKPDY